jgi:hypothetical protein
VRRVARLIVAALVLASCSSAEPARSPSPPIPADLVIPTTVPNGKVEVVVKRVYTVGETVRAVVRLVPATGTLRGPLDPIIQASGFNATLTVKHLAVDPVTVTSRSSDVIVVWDMRDDSGQPVGGDDYSLVFTVIDNTGRASTVGTTLQIR